MPGFIRYDNTCGLCSVLLRTWAEEWAGYCPRCQQMVEQIKQWRAAGGRLSAARIRLFLGGNRAGKTMAGTAEFENSPHEKQALFHKSPARKKRRR